MSAQSSAARAVTSARVQSSPSLAPVPGAKGLDRLHVVRAPLQSASRAPFLLLCMAILGGALLAALLLNVAMVRGSYEHTDLRLEVGQAAQDIQSLQSDLAAAENGLPDRAATLGMVPAEPPRMIELSTGQVVGDMADAGQ